MAQAPIIYKPGPTMLRAILSRAMYKIFMGNRGSGKTVGALMDFVHQARILEELGKLEGRKYLPLKCPVIRDTRVNLGQTTAKSIKEWFPSGHTSKWRGKEEAPEWAMIVDPVRGNLIEFLFIGCDQPSDLNRFQSYECGAAWIEEPAPAGDLSSGIDMTVLMLAVSSSRSNPNFSFVCSTNPPPPDHWLVQLWPELLDDPDERELLQIDVPVEVMARFKAASAVFKIPMKENKAEERSPGYLQRMEDMFLMGGRTDLADRLVHGHVRDVQIGEPVTPEFDESLFVVPGLAAVRPGESLLASWDGGHQPACVIWRPRYGQTIEILAAFQAEHAGMRQFIQSQVLPWLAVHVPDGVRWQHTGDPNLKTGDMGNSEESALKVILELLPTSSGWTPMRSYDAPRPIFEQNRRDGQAYELGGGWVQGPTSKQDREQPVHEILNPRWRPALKIDKRFCRPLIRALGGDWRRKKDSSGRMISEDWVKNVSANTAEAFAYGCALFTKRRGSDDVMSRHRQRQQQMDRHAYAGDGTNV